MLGRRKDIAVRLGEEDHELLLHIAAELEHICSALNGEPDKSEGEQEDGPGNDQS